LPSDGRQVEVRESSVQRTYAGILAATAFTVETIRGWAAGADPSAVVPRAVIGLLVFACLGAIVAHAALWMVEEGVNARLRESLAENDMKKPPKQ
jgi:hypothetical protein